jgi:tripartite-type tricarboxylate transporter receptor subunit TctC
MGEILGQTMVVENVTGAGGQIAKMNGALPKTLADPAISKRLTGLAVDLPSKEEASPEALRNLLKDSIDKWVPTVPAAGMKPE